MGTILVQKIDGITPLTVYNDLRKIAKSDYRNRDSRLAAVNARMTRLESELAEYAMRHYRLDNVADPSKSILISEHALLNSRYFRAVDAQRPQR
jgi:hypothetical protein